MQVGAITAIAGRAQYSLTDDTAGKVAVRFGTTGIDVELGLQQRLWDPYTVAYVGVVYGIMGAAVAFALRFSCLSSVPRLTGFE